MYDILELKGKLLPELQGIAKELSIPKFRALKKMDLIYQILDLQAISPKKTVKEEPKVAPKPKVVKKSPTPKEPSKVSKKKKNLLLQLKSQSRMELRSLQKKLFKLA
mgnify:CR=1 FL=1